jgi:hypothetical protein
MLNTQTQELNDVGLQISAVLMSTTLDPSLVLQQRARMLLFDGQIQHGEVLRVHVIADAFGIFNANRTNKIVVVLKM